MRASGRIAAAALVAWMAAGCAWIRQSPGRCRLVALGTGTLVGAGAGAGAAAAADPDSDKQGAYYVAGGIGGGVVGAIVGAVAGRYLCPAEAPPPPPPPPSPPPPPAPGTKLETLAGPHFAFDSAALTVEGRARVGAAARALRDHADVRVRVEGHTDAIGSDAYNLRLSERRAVTVHDALVAEGIDAGRIEAVGLGKSQPIADNRTPEGRAQNRRVDIVVR